MKHWARILPLSALVLLCGCGGGGVKGAGGAGGGIPGSTSHGVNIAGNWQFSTTSTAGGSPPAIAGRNGSYGGSVNCGGDDGGLKYFYHILTLVPIGTTTCTAIYLT